MVLWYIILMNTNTSNRLLRPVKGVENYWIWGTPGVLGCIGITYNNYYGRWTTQDLMDSPTMVAEDLRGRSIPRANCGAEVASKDATSAQDVVKEMQERIARFART